MSTTISYEEAGRVLAAALARATESASASCVAVLPLHRDGRLVGAIGVGGGSPDQDADIAAAGAGSLSAVPA